MTTPNLTNLLNAYQNKSINDKLMELWNFAHELGQLETISQDQKRQQILGLLTSILKERLENEK